MRQPKDRQADGRFSSGHGKTPRSGRPLGSQNKTTRAVKEFLAALVARADIQDAVADRILSGDAVVFFRALEHVVGKPSEKAEMNVKGDLNISWKD